MVEQDIIQERLSFLEIDGQVSRGLVALWPLVEPALPGILSRFYDKLRLVPHLAMMLGNHQDRLVSADFVEKLGGGASNVIQGNASENAYLSPVVQTHKFGMLRPI